MSKYCPIQKEKVVYLVCQECEEKKCINNIFRCLVIGSRTFDDYNRLEEVLDYLLKNQLQIEIISGGAKGADTLARQYAIKKGYLYKEFPADWNTYGKKAGYIRNKQMCEYISQYAKYGMIAFWDGESRGTKQDIDLAKEMKIPYKIIKI